MSRHFSWAKFIITREKKIEYFIEYSLSLENITKCSKSCSEMWKCSIRRSQRINKRVWNTKNWKFSFSICTGSGYEICSHVDSFPKKVGQKQDGTISTSVRGKKNLAETFTPVFLCFSENCTRNQFSFLGVPVPLRYLDRRASHEFHLSLNQKIKGSFGSLFSRDQLSIRKSVAIITYVKMWRSF